MVSFFQANLTPPKVPSILTDSSTSKIGERIGEMETETGSDSLPLLSPVVIITLRSSGLANPLIFKVFSYIDTITLDWVPFSSS